MDLALPPMPFSAVFVPIQGQSALNVPEEMRTPGTAGVDRRITLPPGVVQVIFSWRGLDPLSIRHYPVDGVNTYETVTTISAASSPEDRSTGVLTFSSAESHQVQVVHAGGGSWNQATIDGEYVVGVQVMPMGTAADNTGGGSLLRVDNSVGTRVFLGDQMIYGDTGLRAASSLLQPGWRASQQLSIRRVGDVVYLTGYVHSDGTATSQLMMEIPRGFHSVGTKALTAPTTAGYPASVQLLELSTAGLKAYGRPLNTSGTIYIETSWLTNYSWPTSLPGTAT